LAPLTSLGLVSSHTNLLAMGQRRYAIKVPRFHQRDEGSHAQPALRVSQAEPPLFFFLVSFCMLHGPMFSSGSIYVGFPKVLNFLGS